MSLVMRFVRLLSQYVPLLAMDKFCDRPGVNVSITVWQLRCGKLAIVSPLATPAFNLCDVGDTGFKTGWVRCSHRAGWGGVGWGLG